MRRLKIFIFISMFLWAVNMALAQKEPQPKDSDVPQGMEAIKVTEGYRLIIPEGAKIKRIGGQIIVEDSREYEVRKFQDLESRLTKMDQNQEEFKKIYEGTKESTSAKLNDMSVQLFQLEKNQEELRQEVKDLKEVLLKIQERVEIPGRTEVNGRTP